MPATRRTCKQLYHEANLLPRTGTPCGGAAVPYDAVFSFASDMVLIRFCNLYSEKMQRISRIWLNEFYVDGWMKGFLARYWHNRQALSNVKEVWLSSRLMLKESSSQPQPSTVWAHAQSRSDAMGNAFLYWRGSSWSVARCCGDGKGTAITF